MDRRRVLVVLTLVAASAALGGCLASDGGLVVEESSYGATADGSFAYNVTVRNTGSDRRSGTLTFTGSINGRSVERAKQVAVPPGRNETYALAFDVPAANVTAFSGDVRVVADGQSGE